MKKPFKKRKRGVKSSIVLRNAIEETRGKFKSFKIENFPLHARRRTPSALTIRIVESLKLCMKKQHFFVPNNKGSEISKSIGSGIRSHMKKQGVNIDFMTHTQTDAKGNFIGVRFQRLD